LVLDILALPYIIIVTNERSKNEQKILYQIHHRKGAYRNG